jgi:PAS domain S-box-containing protein
LLVCGLLQRWIEPAYEAPFIAAIALSAWLCGTPYAVASVALSIPALNLLFAPSYSFYLGTSSGLTKLILFVASSGVIIALIAKVVHGQYKLAEAEQRHRNLSELIPFGGWTADANGNMTTLSASFLNAFGVTLDQCRGLRWLDLIEEPQREQVRAEWLDCMRSGYFWDYQYKMRARDGSLFTVLSRGVPVRRPDGRVQSWVGIHLDVTEIERIAEDRIQHARDIARFNAELEQLAYVASHDLQEPLRTIASYLQLLSRRYKGKLDAEADVFIDYAVDGASRLKELLQDLMLLQQIGKSSRKRSRCNLSEIATKALKHVSARWDGKTAALSLEPLPVVVGDESELIQLFENLLDNSIKYARPDVPPALRISAERAAAEWVIRLKDNGIGIEPQYLRRIFEVFQRLHSRSDYPGNGIGLAICKKIVEVHHGRIWAESTPGEGATFCFTLPAE